MDVMGEGLRRCARTLNMNMAIAPTSVWVGLALVDIGPCAVRGLQKRRGMGRYWFSRPVWSKKSSGSG